jgi:hypothetical protein
VARHLPLAGRVTPAAGLLLRAALVSILLFLVAHALLFHLHLPSRYSKYSGRVVLAVAGAVTWTIAGDALRRLLPRRGLVRGGALLAAAAVVAAFVVEPFLQHPGGSYVVGEEPGLYRFLEAQPRDVLVASISPEADNIPTFARRSVLIGSVFAIPYQLGYYRPFRRRAEDLLRAQYAEDPRVLRAFIRSYGVDYFVVDRWVFRPRSVSLDSWVRQYRPLVGEIAARLARGSQPALERMTERCAVLETERLSVVDARCLLDEGRTASGLDPATGTAPLPEGSPLRPAPPRRDRSRPTAPERRPLRAPAARASPSRPVPGSRWRRPATAGGGPAPRPRTPRPAALPRPS